jgi:hypothetical protein
VAEADWVEETAEVEDVTALKNDELPRVVDTIVEDEALVE